MKRVILPIETSAKEQIIDVTQQVQAVVSKEFAGRDGFVHVYCPHTTAGVAVNEGDDPDVKRDFLLALGEVIHFEEQFHHAEGNSKAHIASTLIGCSSWIAVEQAKLVLGHWQSIWFCEFDGPRKRTLWVNGILT